jgi:ubiquinone/menaquinone biosynthesis C-methylase UbiE
MRIGKFIINKLIPFVVSLTGVQKGSWREKKYNIVMQSLIMAPFKRLKGIRRISKNVEKQYDEISGLYIKDNYYEGRTRYSVVSGQIEEISSIENMRLIRTEINQALNEFNFNSVLEVGVGELTTLEDIYRNFGPDIDCYGVDLSVNRIYHGLSEYCKRHEKLPIVMKANAIKLPFPDNSFDLVYTRHTLEQMPTIYKEALSEIIRVSKKQIVLFEPSFELSGIAQKIKMLNSDYVKGIPKYLNSRSDIQLENTYLMKNSANPLNHTACYKIKVTPAVEVEKDLKPVFFVCPHSKAPLEEKKGYLYCKKSSRAYPIIEGIPILDYDYSLYITEPDS